jgi:hypothetical protein
MRSFKLDEISAVDKPAQEGAKVAIMKRKTDDALASQLVKGYLAKLQLAEPVYAAIAKSLNNKEASQAWDNLAVLETSLHSIVGDSNLSDNDKISMMKSSVGEFLEHSRKETPNLETRLEKALIAKPAKSEKAKSNEDGAMNLRQLQKQMRELNGKLDSLLAKQRTRKEVGQQLEIDDSDMMGKEKVGPAGAAMSDEDEAAARLRALLSGGEKEAAGYTASPGGMPGQMMEEMDKENGDSEETEEVPEEEPAEEDEFLEEEAEKADSDEQDEGLTTTEGEEEEPIGAGAARPIGGGSGKRRTTKRVRLYDDTIVVEGRTFTKAKVGSGLFTVLQQQQQRLNKVEKQALEERAARELMEFAKVAEDELPNLPGTAEQKASLLKTLSSTLSQEERQLISKMFRAGNGGLARAFNTLGTAAGGDIAKARNGFEKRITEIRARDNCTRIEAMQKARRENPEEFAAYQGN